MRLEQPNFYSLIADKTKDFVGREWVFDEIDNWLSSEPSQRSKYFIITGKAGYGKSSIAARLIEISNTISETSVQHDNNMMSKLTLGKDFLAASYVISFKDNLSTDPKSLAKSLSSQMASKFEGFRTELVNSVKTSTVYDIDINASQKQIDANQVSGSNIVINVHGSSTALSVFNDLVRNPLQSFLKSYTGKKLVFLIDGLDESILSSADEGYADSMISILSNLEGINDVYFILTTRDYRNILSRFRGASSVLDISSKTYVNSINNDLTSFVKLHLDRSLSFADSKEQEQEKIVHKLVVKAEGNFLYIKFVMDAIVEGKITLSTDELESMPIGLYGMYNLFFSRMVIQIGKESWKHDYHPILRALLVSFEGLEPDQISLFTRIQRDKLQEIFINLKPFIVEEFTLQNEKKRSRYKLYHQSLVEFLKKEHLDDDTVNEYFISEKDAHRNIVEKYYDVSKDEFKISSYMKEYGLKHLPDHLFALIDYDDPEGIDWYTILLKLAINQDFEIRQLQFFPHEIDLPLKTIIKAFDASIEKNDKVSTAEMLLRCDAYSRKILTESPIFNSKI